MQNSRFLNCRMAAMISLALITPIGFAVKFYSGPAAPWVNNSLGGLFYELFWCLVLFVFLPRLAPLKIAALVFGGTCMLELLQLWHPPFLETIRATFIGATLLGTTFAWSDFIYYLIGCVAGGLYLNFLIKFTPRI
jgi:hypothetical protein